MLDARGLGYLCSAGGTVGVAESKIREEICTVGASLYSRRYTVGSAGNISARLDDGWLITPTDACLGRLDPNDIAKVGCDGQHLSGGRPSKTLALHRRIYENSPETRGVVHTHSTNLVALTLSGVWSTDDIIPPITPYYVMKVGHVPLIKYHRPGAPEVADQIAALAPKVRAVLLERLGPVVWEKTVSAASFALEELEETALLWMSLARSATPLSTDAIGELRDTFGARW
ncbi:aldolase [Trinickia sp. EG282A]|uniref:3-oxo-tetronate 4-phosphate decarboxylase n=1 Tax=Trinickia sp. EG282A TaxID=3237013 RepID=UPI0034D2E477